MNRAYYPSLTKSPEYWRKRQKLPKRKKRIWIKSIIIILFFIFFIELSYYGFLAVEKFIKDWEFLKVKDIIVHTENMVIKKEVEEKIRKNNLESVILADTNRIRESIMKNPYVKDVKIKKILPSTIEIFIKDRKGMAILNDVEYYIIDENGEIIEKVEKAVSLPVIKGVSAKDKIAIEMALSFIKELKKKGKDEHVEEIDISNPFNIGVITKNSKIKVYLGESDFSDKFERFLKIEEALKKEFGRIEYVGFCDKERVYVKKFKI